ncbi:STAS domain-containing protein [Pseudalkalibacillus berkeleyi]|uniref:STAS domain-containing protein n=1 Tax=Pseudalkalibacillus berkeleyi TaxID=1069813 RepID=A0ABS9GV26_9BACL|nr:STAS domain-containing protein [Pseudalkalibacillus berkeleyi]MCF6136693.1 STAS domain-containing protein [Pseudalkalibacillus berkeleyi]
MNKLAELLLGNKEKIASEIVELRMKDITTDNDFFTEESLKERALDMITLIGDNLNCDVHSDIEEVVKWGSDKGKQAVVVEAPLSEALRNTPYYRKVLWTYIAELSKDEDFSKDEIIQIANRLDPILDQAVYGYSKSYVEYNIEIAMRYQDALLELSVPVVPLFEGIAVLPIIGDIDTNRAQHITDKTIERCEELKLERIIIDLSGVNIVDTMVAQHLFQLVKTLRLLGVKSAITGIRSAVAITAVNLGIELNDLNIFTTLQQALEALGYKRVNEETIH